MVAVIGEASSRVEDKKFLTGAGKYLDDLEFPDVCYAVFIRSPHAHARILSLSTAIAKEMPGVLDIVTADDVELSKLNALKPFIQENPNTGERFSFVEQPLLAQNITRYQGEPIVLVIAATLAQALDASELVEIEYSPLPHVVDVKEAVSHKSIKLNSQIDGNIAVKWNTGNSEGIEKVFDNADQVVSLSIQNQRIVTNPMEPRGVVADWSIRTGRYTLYGSSQNIHVMRTCVADMLGITEESVRFIAPDVGGGFGSKNFCYTEYGLIAWMSKKLRRPVKWIASRSEGFLSDHQGRDHQSEVQLALRKDGKFLALKVTSYANLGAYLVGSAGGVQVVQYANLPGTVYNVPVIELKILGVLTNTTPIGVFRGPGYAEANLIIERIIDKAAHQCGFDRAELRRMNLYKADDMPFTNALGGVVDSGNFPKVLDMALKKADYSGFNARKKKMDLNGLLRGIGFAYHIKGTGGAPDENVDVRFNEDATISLIMGTQSIGQGHETTFPQILASQLGISKNKVVLASSDTDRIAFGGGHGSSRSTYMGGTAIFNAVQDIISKGKTIAANEFETSVEDLSFANGSFTVSGTDKSLSIFEVAELGRNLKHPLDTYKKWTREAMTFPNGAHVAEVEIDPDTGIVKLKSYTAVDDYGVLVNPSIVKGQMHGAIAQGVGQALLETVIYDESSAQMLTGSFMDYAVPRADDLPFYETAFESTPCATNPLGVKGCGEAGTIAAPSAISSAIIDALRPFGITHIDGPATPEKIWSLIRPTSR
ncbi:xanthine dehydrogenase family protein molybdopterin-binding subunit [Alphaproteobacteria bacterium]|nr:xanthine dehydrogenase family protein molybdopterin-binding subunit [Alphaproteobacteria bacterium]